MRDVIIIGARCAGSPLDMLLVRMGHDILLVDKDEPGLDHPYSALLLHPPGVAHLKQWGLLDRVLDRSGCRKIHNWHVDVGPFSINTSPHADVDFGLASRRLHLDEVLCQAAAESGVEVRHNYPVQELIFEGARVSISMTTSLAAYEQKRNVAEIPYYDLTHHAATLQPPDEKTLKLF